MKLDEFIETIGYNKEWFELGFLPLEFVEQQLGIYQSSDDKDVQHYKWAGYRYILSNENFNDTKRVDDFVSLIENDPNSHLYKGALNELIDAGIVDRSYLLKFKNARFLKEKSVLDRLGE